MLRRGVISVHHAPRTMHHAPYTMHLVTHRVSAISTSCHFRSNFPNETSPRCFAMISDRETDHCFRQGPRESFLSLLHTSFSISRRRNLRRGTGYTLSLTSSCSWIHFSFRVVRDRSDCKSANEKRAETVDGYLRLDTWKLYLCSEKESVALVS